MVLKGLDGFKTLTEHYFKQIFRSRLLVVLMFFLPLYFIVTMNVVHPERPIMIPIGDVLAMGILSDLATMTVVTVVVSLLCGVFGFFIIKESRTDPRLKIVGFSDFEILGSKLLLLSGVVLFTTAFSFLVMFYLTIPENITWFLIGVLLAGANYSFIGVLAGFFLNKLPGMYLMLFMPTLDLMLFQSPMVDRDLIGEWVKYLPGHNPMRIVLRASLGLDQEIRILLYSLFFLALLFAITFIVFYTKIKTK